MQKEYTINGNRVTLYYVGRTRRYEAVIKSQTVATFTKKEGNAIIRFLAIQKPSK